MDENLYPLLGEAGFEGLVASFYRRVREDDLLAPMYPAQDMEGAEERLKDFLVGRFGGPSRYIEQRGHPRLRMRHAGFTVDQAARDRWVTHMRAALEENALPAEVAQFLEAFFDQTATFLMNRPPA